MEYITICMSGLALLAAIVCLILIIQEKKRNQERNAALLNYVDKECDAAREFAGNFISAKIDNLQKHFDFSVDGARNELHEKLAEDKQWLNDRINKHYDDLRHNVNDLIRGRKHDVERIEDMQRNLKNLMDGVIPDYNEALAAKQAVDNFNLGLSAIMGFDPLEAAKKTRNERMGADVK